MTENTRPEDLNRENSLNTPKKGESTMSSAEKEQKRISRREFVKGAAVGAAGVAAAGVLASCAQEATPCPTPEVIKETVEVPVEVIKEVEVKPWLPEKWDYEADVVVVGSGLAGVSTAIAAHDAGAEVLVLEKAPERFIGGNSRTAGGGMRTPLEVSDEVITTYRDYCFGTVPDELCVDFVEALYRNPERIKKLGYDLVPSGTQSPTIGHLRIVTPEAPEGGRGFQLYDAFKGCFDDRRLKIMCETPAKELIQDPVTKEILGVVAAEGATGVLGEGGKKIYIKAKRAVVLACGGYENNNDMKGWYNYPGLGESMCPWGTPYNTGDGIKMVSEIGAPLWHLFSVEWDRFSLKVPSLIYGVGVQTASTGHSIIVNKYGKRFMNEAKRLVHNKETLEYIYFRNVPAKEYANMPCFIIFDETYRLARPLANTGGTMTWNVIHELYKWSADNSVEIGKGWILKGDTIEELAAKITAVDPRGYTVGVDAAGLKETISAYNGYCAAGEDPDFGKPEDRLIPIVTPPYYAAELALTLINTQGGPKHNGKSQTLNKEDKPIPRLYSCGELGSFFGMIYPGGSNLAEAIAFGHIAGENAAAETPWD
jgi:succinate dehydrogenase/fumarate reductase flavoprotein subunit